MASIDLAPIQELYQIDLSAIYKILKKHGVALIGGGFGKYTPRVVIKGMAKRSRELNLRAGKVEVSEDEILKKVGSELLPGHIETVSEGGLWVIMRK